ncbi:MAG: hypothetical protein KatS3mg114_0239 [Planctomycetaceae bacterium]|nr:MAG: hypothetical protein KatS3mg114_0239 [Planctomycetaceae bacterium]
MVSLLRHLGCCAQHRGLLAGVFFLIGHGWAWATCGDYLHMPHHPASDHQTSVELQKEGHPAHPTDPIPCQGPSCRRSTPIFPTPSSPTGQRIHDQWAWYLRDDSRLALLWVNLSWEPPCSLSQGSPQRIERPPRL